MKTVYIDSEFKCHVSNDGGMTEVATEFFDGKCDEYIEGFRFIPYYENWTRSDGVVFHGEMLAPWKDYVELDYAQRQYEKEILAIYAESYDKAQAYDILTGVSE